eukprot:jgi/Chrzof1/12213/Cz06g25160.t1
MEVQQDEVRQFRRSLLVRRFPQLSALTDSELASLLASQPHKAAILSSCPGASRPCTADHQQHCSSSSPAAGCGSTHSSRRSTQSPPPTLGYSRSPSPGSLARSASPLPGDSHIRTRPTSPYGVHEVLPDSYAGGHQQPFSPCSPSKAKADIFRPPWQAFAAMYPPYDIMRPAHQLRSTSPTGDSTTVQNVASSVRPFYPCNPAQAKQSIAVKYFINSAAWAMPTAEVTQQRAADKLTALKAVYAHKEQQQ